MPPKKGAKGKKGGKFEDDDAHWEKLASKASSPAAASPVVAGAGDDDDDDIAAPISTSKKGGFSSFVGYEDMVVDEDDDEGGLMSVISKNKKKPKKKSKQAQLSEDDDAAAAADDDNEGPDAGAKRDEPEQDMAAPRGIVEVGADDWMEDEFGPTKPKKGKAGKKGKGGKKAAAAAGPDADDDDEFEKALAEVTGKVAGSKLEEEKPAKAVEPAAEAQADEPNAAGEEGDEPKGVMSKKEKERLKKEKEKAKKKAQAAAKKAAAGNAPAPAAEATPEPKAEAPVKEATPAAEAAEENEDEEAEGGEGAGKKDKKKKKKKAAEKKEPAPAPVKKPNARIAALQAAMEAQKKAAEEAARAEEEERKRIEEEERKAEEEERLKAEEKARRKEKEKAKREQLKKEGKLLTPKQKAEKAAAEARLKALVEAGGVTVAGLQNKGDEAPRRVNYGNKKKPQHKKGPAATAQAPAAEPTPEAVVEAPVKAQEAPKPVEDAKAESDEDVKDDWDASSDEEKAESVKDDWDASSDEEEQKKEETPKAAPAPAPSKANGKAPTSGAKVEAKAPAKQAEKVAPVTKQPAKAQPPATKAASKPTKAAAVAEESSEESEEDSDDDSDDSDDDSDDSDDDDSDEDSSEDEDGLTSTQRMAAQRKAEAKERRLAKEAEALKARSKDNMRSPICVILGHVDTGKTSLLDKIRQTNVQEGEAGGITQQIGATYFPMDAIKSKTEVLGVNDLKEYKLPGLLVIDTPGHESFTNLRTRGSSLCNIAILVVDLMHGLEPQTLESLRLLRDGKTPFIVALNKVDRLYGWKAIPNGGFQDSLAAQSTAVKREFEKRLSETVLAFAEQGLNACPYYDNKDFARVVSLVPTSAFTGEGVPDMLMLIIKLTQERMTERLMYLSTLECTVLEVKVIEGLGTTIDVVLSNGVLHEGDKIVVCGLNGAITTQVRALLTPQPMKELRIKGQYVHHKEVKASLGIKIVAPDLEKAIAGSRLLVLGEDDDEEELREEVMSDLSNLMNSVDKSGRGVCVQASTLGSLEALLEFLRVSKIPVSGINIGPVHKKDIMRASAMLEKAKEFAVILCFDVPVDKEAERMAEEFGIKIFKADIIYHLFDQFTAYNKQIVDAKRADSAPKAVWPCRLKTIACFAKRDPIILGCDIIDGSLRIGTPLCVVKTDPETKHKEIISLGKITGLEINHKVKEMVKKSEAGGGVAVKIEHASYESAKQYGRHFDDKDEVISMISRESIDVLKTTFRDDVSKDDWLLIKGLKSKLDIA